MNKLSKQERDALRTNTPERVGMDEIKKMPAMLDTDEYGSIVGMAPLTVARLCREGKLPAVRCGRSWRINKAKALEMLGLA